MRTGLLLKLRRQLHLDSPCLIDIAKYLLFLGKPCSLILHMMIGILHLNLFEYQGLI